MADALLMATYMGDKIMLEDENGRSGANVTIADVKPI